MPEQPEPTTRTHSTGLPGAQKLPATQPVREARTSVANHIPSKTSQTERSLLSPRDSPSPGDRRRDRGLPYGDIWISRLGRALSRLFYTDTYPDAFAQAADACQSPVTTGRRIGVISPSGGSGASTVTAALAALFAFVRTDEVAAVDFTPAPSGLISRLPADEADEGLPAGLGRLKGISEAEDDDITLTEFGPSPRSQLLRLNYAPTDRLLSAYDIAEVHRALSRSRAISVSEIPRPALDLTLEMDRFHVLVAVLSSTPAAERVNSQLLHELSRRASDIPVLPVVVDSRRSSARTRAHVSASARATLRDLGMSDTVLKLNHDRHLATGGELRIGRIGESRRLQLAQIGAAALEAAVGGRS